MPGVPVRFILDDGESLTLPGDDVEHVYELLWTLAPKPGAISVAAAIKGATGASTRRSPIDLDLAQSAVLREALAQLRPRHGS